MINIEILRLEINELLYNVEVFLDTDTKLNVKEALKEIFTNFMFAELDNSIYKEIINECIKSLSLVMYTHEYNILLNNISTLTKFINNSF